MQCMVSKKVIERENARQNQQLDAMERNRQGESSS